MGTQIYSFYLDNPPSNQFLFNIKLEVNFRPVIGDSISNPITQENFRVMRDEFTLGGFVRITDTGLIRLTDDGNIRVTTELSAPKFVTHKYFIQPANKPSRVSTWTETCFANDRTLDQLYNNRWS